MGIYLGCLDTTCRPKASADWLRRIRRAARVRGALRGVGHGGLSTSPRRREVEDKMFKAKYEAGIVPEDSHKRADARHGEHADDESTTMREEE